MRRAQIVFASSVTFTLTTISVVHYLQYRDTKVRRIGIERDDQTRSRKRMENELEAKLQKELQDKLVQEQGVSRKSWRDENVV